MGIYQKLSAYFFSPFIITEESNIHKIGNYEENIRSLCDNEEWNLFKPLNNFLPNFQLLTFLVT